MTPDFLSIIENCGSIHDQVAQLEAWYNQEQQQKDHEDFRTKLKNWIGHQFVSKGCYPSNEETGLWAREETLKEIKKNI